MASTTSTQLLDLAQTISNAALTVAKHELQEQDALSAHAAANGLNGTVKQPPPASTPPQAVLEAKANLVQATSDLSILALGPGNYLKSLSYSVRLSILITPNYPVGRRVACGKN